MQHYDLSYLISPQTEEAKVKELHQKILEDLQKEGAVLDRVQDPNKISLAYPVQKQKEAYFAWLRFFLKKEKTAALNSKLSSEPALLRFVLVKKEKEKEKPRRQKTKALKTKESWPKREKVELAEVEKKLDEIL